MTNKVWKGGEILKDFKEFRKLLTSDLLDKWSEEIHNDVISKIDKLHVDDPVAWNLAYHHSYSLALTIRTLEMYHKWLNE